MTDELDDSILNQEDGDNADEIIDLNDAEQVAELLGEQEVPPEDVMESLENSGEVAREGTVELDSTDEIVIEQEIQIQEEEGGSDDLIFLGEDDDDVVEEILKPEELQEHENSPIFEGGSSSSSRKRLGSGGISKKAPAFKRNRRVHTYFGTRQVAINMITQLLGSYDAFIPRKDFLNECASQKYMKIVQEKDELIKSLFEENKRVKEHLVREIRAHKLTAQCLEHLEEKFRQVEVEMERLYPLLTQPATPEVLDIQFPMNNLQLQPAQYIVQPNIPPVPPEYRNLSTGVNYVPSFPRERITPLQRRNELMMFQNQQIAPPPPNRRPAIMRRVPAGNAVMTPQMSPHQIQRQPPLRSAPPKPPPVPILPRQLPRAQRDSNWDAIPIPKNSLGHRELDHNPNLSQILRDVTLCAGYPNTVVVHVPLVSPENILPRSESSRSPDLPARFKLLRINHDLNITINSTTADFRDNWMLGGKISYENLLRLHNKEIQVFIQLSSFKTLGITGWLPGSFTGENEQINWGVSQKHQCRQKSHKFRLVFHQQQVIPLYEKITFFVVTWENNQPIEMSLPLSMHL